MTVKAGVLHVWDSFEARNTKARLGGPGRLPGLLKPVPPATTTGECVERGQEDHNPLKYTCLVA